MSFYDKVRRQKFLSFYADAFYAGDRRPDRHIAQTGAKAAKEQVAAPDATPLTIPSPFSAERIHEDRQAAGAVGGEHSNRIHPQEADYHAEQAKSPVPPPAATADPDEGGDDDDNGMQQFFQRFFGSPRR